MTDFERAVESMSKRRLAAPLSVGGVVLEEDCEACGRRGYLISFDGIAQRPEVKNCFGCRGRGVRLTLEGHNLVDFLKRWADDA